MGATVRGYTDPRLEQSGEPAGWPAAANEDARLVALQRYGLQRAQPAADREQLEALARLAAHVCGTESGSVDIVTSERQWTAAVHRGEPGETGRAEAPAAHVVASRQAAVVDDATDPETSTFEGSHLVAAKGLRRWVAAPLTTSDGHVLGALTASSITAGSTTPEQLARLADLARQVMVIFELRRLSATVSRLATHDSLTGLANRRGFSDALDSALRRAERGLGSPSVVVVNLEGLAEINDSLGHGATDVLLKTVAARLISTARRADTVARMGREEFAVLLEHTGGPGATGALSRLRSALAGAVDVDGRRVDILASLGVATYRPGDTPASLLSRADAAMYQEKAPPLPL